jgi:hypothetical protein
MEDPQRGSSCRVQRLLAEEVIDSPDTGPHTSRLLCDERDAAAQAAAGGDENREIRLAFLPFLVGSRKR